MSGGAARLCGRCGRVRPISQRAGPNGFDICSSCWRPPTAVCTVCGDERPCSGVAAGRPICSRCRPRRTSQCAHCGATRPAAAHWPEGPICDPATPPRCVAPAPAPTAGATGAWSPRRVRRPTPAPRVRARAPPGVCTGCGAEDKLYTRGYCARCTLARRTDELLSDPSGIVPNTLAAVRDAVVATRTPRTALNWLRKEQGLRSWPRSRAATSR